MVILFDELFDLSLIEIFSYLSAVNALSSFNNLNIRLTNLLTERGFYRCIIIYHRSDVLALERFYLYFD